MADTDRTRVLTDRYSSVVRVLYRVLVLNLAVAVVKIALGYATGAVSILSDGFHSLTDSASNVVALVGVSIARRPPDENHPYGHRKYETMASLGILAFLVIVLVQVLGAAYTRLLYGGTPKVFPEGIGIMAVTLVVNVFVVIYEGREARRLNSEVLRADARHTPSRTLSQSAVGSRRYRPPSASTGHGETRMFTARHDIAHAVRSMTAAPPVPRGRPRVSRNLLS